MIPNMWYAILESNEIKQNNKPHSFKRMGKELVFWRDKEGKLAVLLDRCPHRSAKLSPGKIVDGNIQCRFHGFQYNNQGNIQVIPANGRNGPKPEIFKCQAFIVQEAHGLVWFWNGEPRETYPPIEWFEDIDPNLAFHSTQVKWVVDYTRAIEAQLDMAHLPFIHEHTIGRGGKTLVNGPYTTLENNKITVWASNQPDVGLPALKPTQLPKPEENIKPMLQFKFPNVWQLSPTPGLQVVNITVPIDDENTITYIRNYQSFVKVPGLRQFANWASNMFNRYALSEDYVVTRTQRPKKADLDIGEQFIPADRPIALYLKQRRDLILAARGQEAQKQLEPELQAALE